MTAGDAASSRQLSRAAQPGAGVGGGPGALGTGEAACGLMRWASCGEKAAGLWALSVPLRRENTDCLLSFTSSRDWPRLQQDTQASR